MPFLDHPLIEFLATHADRLKLRGLTTKYVLRQAMRDLFPAPILSRRKMGFPVPLRAWFRGEQGALLDEFVLGARARTRAVRPEIVQQLVAEHRSGEGQRRGPPVGAPQPGALAPIFVDGEGATVLGAAGFIGSTPGGCLMRIALAEDRLLHPV